MKIIKALSWICFLAFAVLLISGSPALAGNEPPDGCTDLPDEVWGVVVLICTLSQTVNDYAVVRVKQIQGCDVVVEVYADPAWAAGCPDLSLGDPEGQVGNFALGDTIRFFGIDGEPYIDTVRNFKQITDILGNTETTFDAKFKFCAP
jgi:hypothetical protein